MNLTFKKFQETNILRDSTYKKTLEEWSTVDWTNALCGEAGEAANLAKKQRRGDKIDSKNIAYEAVDVICYSILLLSHLGYDAEEIIKEKFNIVSDRFKTDIKL